MGFIFIAIWNKKSDYITAQWGKQKQKLFLK